MTTNIYTLLSQYKLGEAITSLQSKVENLRDVSIMEQFYVLSDNYRAYLRVQVQQSGLPSRSDVEEFYRQAYSINDRANRRIRLFKAPNDQYSIATGSLGNMFNRIWTADAWNDTERANIDDYVESFPEQVPLMVTAATLALCEMFDEKKLMFLFDVYGSSDQVASLRSLIGLIIVLRRYDSRMAHYPQVSSRLSLLSDDQSFVKLFFNAHVILQYSKMTQFVTDKMRNDIMPTLIKSTRFRKSDLGLEEIDQALSGNGENPDWVRKNASDEKVEKKIQQMAKMQTEGADIYMATFRHMKNFTFFSTMQNWFEPFSFSHPQLQDYEHSTLTDGILTITPFCDSDKYSFVFMLKQMGSHGTNAIMSQVEQQLPEDMSINDIVSDARNDMDSRANGKSAEKIMRRYSQDLYRFFTIYPYHSQFFNPFDEKLSAFTPLHRQSFTSMLKYHEELLTLAEFLMRKGVHSDALEIFRLVETKTEDEDRADLLQKIGFCEQKMGRIRDSYYDLLEADTLKPRSRWTISHLFQTAFELKMYEEAIKYLDMLIEPEPDDLKLITKKAECLFALDRFQEALPILYKVVYLDDESLTAHQMLAWALLMAGSHEKSAKEYAKCLELNDYSAFIYLGYLELLGGNPAKACDSYRQALNHFCSDSTNQQDGLDKFLKSFWSPAPYLPKIDTHQLSILLDHVLLNS